VGEAVSGGGQLAPPRASAAPPPPPGEWLAPGVTDGHKLLVVKNVLIPDLRRDTASRAPFGMPSVMVGAPPVYGRIMGGDGRPLRITL